jgi:hypothetical protein
VDTELTFNDYDGAGLNFGVTTTYMAGYCTDVATRPKYLVFVQTQSRLAYIGSDHYVCCLGQFARFVCSLCVKATLPKSIYGDTSKLILYRIVLSRWFAIIWIG